MKNKRKYLLAQHGLLIQEFERWPSFYTKEQMIKMLLAINAQIDK